MAGVLPLVLNADDVSKALHISRANANNLFHLGKQMLTPRDRFLRWIEENTR